MLVIIRTAIDTYCIDCNKRHHMQFYKERIIKAEFWVKINW